MHAEGCRDFVPRKLSGFCKYQPDKKHSCRLDFWSLCRYGLPIEVQSKVSYCVSNCNWWKHRYYRCTTGHIHLQSLTITEEFVESMPMMDTTTAADIFRVRVDQSCAVSLATDCAPSVIQKKAGVATKFREKVETANGGCDLWTFHCILHQEVLYCKSLKMDNIWIS